VPNRDIARPYGFRLHAGARHFAVYSSWLKSLIIMAPNSTVAPTFQGDLELFKTGYYNNCVPIGFARTLPRLVRHFAARLGT
jgi:hypothetical protein